MYARPTHRAQHDDHILEIIRSHPFATLITPAGSGVAVSHLPFVEENGVLYAHMARANEHHRVLDHAQSLVIFNGPHGYVSPAWYPDRGDVPTWDYVAVHWLGTARIHDAGEAYRNMERMVAVMENGPDAWSMSELREGSAEKLISAIVSFEIPATQIEAKFKLHQGQPRERIDAVIARSDAELSSWIRRYNE